MKIKNKKAAIGLTLTWFVAFLIIFFVMILFVSFSSMLAVKRTASLGEGFSNIELSGGENLGSLENQERLITILNANIDNKTMKELIVEWYDSRDEDVKKKIEDSVKIILENQEDECYVFLVNWDNWKFKYQYISVQNIRNIKFKTSQFDIVEGDKKINTRLFTSKSKDGRC